MLNAYRLSLGAVKVTKEKRNFDEISEKRAGKTKLKEIKVS